MKVDVVGEKATSIAEVKHLLEKLKEKGDLNFRAQKTLDYVQSVSSLDKKRADELKAHLEKLNISRLKEAHIQKIIDLLPKTAEDVKVVTQAFSVSLSQDALKKIADAVQEYVK